MTYTGEVRGGVVVLENGASLPDGTKVSVQPLNGSPAIANPGKDDPLLRLGDLAVDTGVTDLGYNVDHYLYGHPRKEPPSTRDGE